ncbi:MAG TPA: nitroreductase family deazaflavin-dependent oxidoreductase [Roseiflexaceae bacterium]|nr:nitroreductase family deazaflavin-dependent oxidoreductase [Roseiflexaceae bacterium]
MADLNDLNEWNRRIIAEFRANHGVVRSEFNGIPLLLLHTTGAKSGQPRINPLAYYADGDRLVIIASKGGAPSNPDWYYNILANPTVTLEVGDEQFQARATAVEEPERTRLFDKVASVMPAFDEYRRKTERTIPVVVLTRV